MFLLIIACLCWRMSSGCGTSLTLCSQMLSISLYCSPLSYPRRKPRLRLWFLFLSDLWFSDMLDFESRSALITINLFFFLQIYLTNCTRRLTYPSSDREYMLTMFNTFLIQHNLDFVEKNSSITQYLSLMVIFLSLMYVFLFKRMSICLRISLPRHF